MTYRKDEMARLNQDAPALPFAELAGHLELFIIKYSRWSVRGFDEDDLRQEILMVLWRLQTQYDPSRGNFLALAKTSVINRLMQLQIKGSNQTLPVEFLECKRCGHHGEKISLRGGKCSQCSNTTWIAHRSPILIRSLNKPIGNANSGTQHVYIDPIDPDMDTEGAALTLIELGADT